jgi:hypothetical protein
MRRKSRPTFKLDICATVARKFRSKRSYVAPDGREVLYGVDWKARSKECIERDGHCMKKVSAGCIGYIRCYENANLAAHHIIHRSKLRDDRLENLTTRCLAHHKQEHVKPRFGPSVKHPKHKLQVYKEEVSNANSR